MRLSSVFFAQVSRLEQEERALTLTPNPSFKRTRLRRSA